MQMLNELINAIRTLTGTLPQPRNAQLLATLAMDPSVAGQAVCRQLVWYVHLGVMEAFNVGVKQSSMPRRCLDWIKGRLQSLPM